MGKVKKIINEIADLVPQTLEGLVLASHGRLRAIADGRALIRTDLENDKVSLLIGGGSGHEPMYTAYVGKGWADVSVAGHIFAAPVPDLIVEAAKSAHRGRGLLFVYGNYAGDNMNFDIAAEMLADEGITARTVRVCDDVAVKDPQERRGIAGAFYMVKVASAACAQTKDLEEAERLVKKAQANVRSLGVAVRAGSLPETGELTFELGDDEIEIGMGAHGEPGVERRKLMRADPLTDEMVRLIVDDLPFQRGDRVAMLLNDLGATTMMELMIVNRRARAVLTDKGIEVVRTDAGPYLTCQEMAGFSLTLMKLDDELELALAAPAWALGYRQM
jgi:phosphoenolpyruvate---glycerone phosphotransferase subunit DhaK